MRACRGSLGSWWRKHCWKAEEEMTDLMNSGHKLNYKEQSVSMFSYKDDHSRTKARQSLHCLWWQNPSNPGWQMASGKSLWPVERVAAFLQQRTEPLEQGYVLLPPGKRVPSFYSQIIQALSLEGNLHKKQVVTVNNGSKSWKIDLGAALDMHEKREVFGG